MRVGPPPARVNHYALRRDLPATSAVNPDAEAACRHDVEQRSLIMNGGELDELEPLAAVRRRDGDLVAFFFVEERTADRRGCRDQALLNVGIFGHDELIGDRLAAGILEVHGRPEPHSVVGKLVEIHQRDLAHPLLEQADPRLHQTLPLFRRMILGVLTQIAQLTRALDFFRQLRLQLALQLLDLFFEFLENLRFHWVNDSSYLDIWDCARVPLTPLVQYERGPY